MRICQLRFENLNSLYGQWSIDFTRPEYLQDGIFVITGPTGAGKSTLLDAICLALYGRTPRLKSISKTTNEIMSRQSGECFAEVTFETGSGRFVAHWSQHRARKKPDGNLVESKHEISDAATGKLLAALKRDTLARVIKETGMDFDRFTRSMLLAQGGFAAFLQAAPDERAPILEQITGTKIYSLISQKVHERLKTEDKKLALLQAQMGGIQILSAEDEIAVSEDLENKQNQEVPLRRQDGELTQNIAWLTDIERLKKEISDVDTAFQKISVEQAAFEIDRYKLKKAQAASELDLEYATLHITRNQQKQEIESLGSLKAAMPEMEKKLAKKKAALENAMKCLEQTCKKQDEQKPVIKEIRAMDLQIAQEKKDQSRIKDECAKIENTLSREENEQKKAVIDEETARKELSRLEAYLKENKPDQDLPMVLSAVKEKTAEIGQVSGQIQNLSEQLAVKNKTLQKETVLYKKHVALCNALKKTHTTQLVKIADLTKEREKLSGGRSLQGYRREYDGLLREMAYQRTIENLEKERNHLVEGKPCPLCGSKDHPFVHDRLPGVDKTREQIEVLARAIGQIEEMDTRLKTEQDIEKQSDLAVREAEKKAVEDQHRNDQLGREIIQLEKELGQARETEEKLKTSIRKMLDGFDVSSDETKKIDTVYAALEKRLNTFHQYKKDKQATEQALGVLVARIKQAQGGIETLTLTLKEKNQTLADHQKRRKDFEKERFARYGTTDPDAEESRLEAGVLTARKARDAAAEDKESFQQQWVAQTARMSDLEKSINSRQPQLAELETGFIKEVMARGFENEQAFLLCRLTLDEKNALVQRAKVLDDRQQELETRKKDRSKQLETQIEKNLTQVPREDLEKEKQKVHVALKEIGQTIGALKQKLADNAQSKARMEQQAAAINAHKKECARWEALHSLIGSADGKKYRNFAQGITFELMVSHANQQLKKMSDRYLLIRDEQQPLELNIVDDYQAGEIRSTKNLSGGESFIVSLSLALGLSNMAGGKIRVDSLFLDEGFGTLDEDALETALQSLSSLHQQGKLIGVISHVPALKESINTQIEIVPVSGGKSRIYGPGCE